MGHHPGGLGSRRGTERRAWRSGGAQRTAAPTVAFTRPLVDRCLDNVVAERFFGSVKGERTAHWHYATGQEARNDVIDSIEMFYNSTRLHSSLGYVSPNDYEGWLGWRTWVSVCP
jgi:transposase InsO family protein